MTVDIVGRDLSELRLEDEASFTGTFVNLGKNLAGQNSCDSRVLQSAFSSPGPLAR